jgi:hypothetical protein
MNFKFKTNRNYPKVEELLKVATVKAKQKITSLHTEAY